ncbi:hypothetical protein JET76_22870 [Pseudomonas putida]|uniref:hypothetical protein n=1 Tax=Pseudomonas putida TaxID=303 RepID=UPI0018E6C7EF|nr:hypothetical protein [Pseudomonas putida]MBI6944171.1 hypothetical protein [Pseudomonas putida]MBI6960337.1 hypothetical protein [Pseudomonas putida]
MTYDPASRPLAPISEQTLKSHVQARTVREVIVKAHERGPKGEVAKWSLWFRLGDPYGRLTPLGSARRPLHTWASLDTLQRYIERLGLPGAAMEW